MRRVLSILLLAVLGLPMLAPLIAIAGSSEASLPACCRKAGAHHCAMDGAALAAQSLRATGAPEFRAPVERCPYAPYAKTTTHLRSLAGPVAQAGYVSLVRYATGPAQTESKRRIARDRSRQKRGPPSFLLS